MSKGISGLFKWTIGHISFFSGRIIPGKDGKSGIYPNRKGNTVEMWARRFNALS